MSTAPLSEPLSIATVQADQAGLSSAEAVARRARDGPNEVAERHRHPLVTFAGKFWGVSA